MNAELSAAEEDAVKELVKMGYARAAGALSDLTGQTVRIEGPVVSIHEARNLPHAIGARLSGELVCVKQAFHGPVTGYVLLLLDEKAMHTLTNAALGQNPDLNLSGLERREGISEVGHILMNACLGAFGNVLRFRATFSVPKLEIGGHAVIARSLHQSSLGLGQALMMQTRLRDVWGGECGNMLLLLGFISLGQLTAEIEAWDRRNRL